MRSGIPFVREHRTYCGEQYMTVDLFQYTEEQRAAARKPRKRREQVSAPKQRNLNDKRARRYFAQLVNTNFDERDLHVTLTYAPKFRPATVREAEHEVKKFLNRVAYARKKQGLPPLRYILVTEGGGLSKKTGKPTRVHHHLILSGDMSRDEIEALWRKPRSRGQARGEKIGFVNADRLQIGENGLEQLTNYLSKDPRGKKRWSASKNLKKPVRTTNDTKYSCRRFEKLCVTGEIYTRSFWEKKYPGYTLAGSADMAIEADPPDDMNAWRVFAKLVKVRQNR